MLRFAYTGRTRSGEKTQGILEADNAAACASNLLKNGISPVTIQETGQSERRGAKKPKTSISSNRPSSPSMCNCFRASSTP